MNKYVLKHGKVSAGFIIELLLSKKWNIDNQILIHTQVNAEDK